MAILPIRDENFENQSFVRYHFADDEYQHGDPMVRAVASARQCEA